MKTAAELERFTAYAKGQGMELAGDGLRFYNTETAAAWTKWLAEAKAFERDLVDDSQTVLCNTPADIKVILPPTVGRKIWFRGIPFDTWGRLPAGTSPAVYGDQPLDATIVYVHGDRMVNVDVVDHVGVHWFMSSVTLKQDGDIVAYGTPHVEWMPYQLGQAKKG